MLSASFERPTGSITALAAEPSRPRRWSHTIWLLAGLVLLVIRCLYAGKMRAGSDETQHLHVVWAWANGLLPYRDVFDNHTPLFHLLYALPFRCLGERPDILAPMRLAVLPLYFVALGSVYSLGKSLFTQRAGLWAAALAGCWPLFFFTELEFRTDVLWTALWLLALAVLVGGVLTPRRALAGGLLLGAAFSTSMKTSVLFFALMGAVVLTLWLALALRKSPSKVEKPAAVIALACAGLLAIPTLIVAFFAWKQALPQFWYGVIAHNIIPGQGHIRVLSHARLCWALFPVSLGLASLFLLTPTQAAIDIRFRRAIFFLTPSLYALGMYGYWPLLTKQDALPAIPLACILVTGISFGALDRLTPRLPWAAHLGTAIATLCFLLEAREIRAEHSLRQHSLDATVSMINTVLRLTKPGEWVMDGKGETIFRPRPYYYALENITTSRMRFGLLQDDIASHLIATRTAVVHDFRLPDGAEQFVHANYLPLAGQEQIFVLGQELTLSPDGKGAEFKVIVPGEYSLVNDGHSVAGMLDGVEFNGAQSIEAGSHHFLGASSLPHLALFSARALSLGYHPAFQTRGPEAAAN